MYGDCLKAREGWCALLVRTELFVLMALTLEEQEEDKGWLSGEVYAALRQLAEVFEVWVWSSCHWKRIDRKISAAPVCCLFRQCERWWRGMRVSASEEETLVESVPAIATPIAVALMLSKAFWEKNA